MNFQHRSSTTFLVILLLSSKSIFCPQQSPYNYQTCPIFVGSIKTGFLFLGYQVIKFYTDKHRGSLSSSETEQSSFNSSFSSSSTSLPNSGSTHSLADTANDNHESATEEIKKPSPLRPEDGKIFKTKLANLVAELSKYQKK